MTEKPTGLPGVTMVTPASFEPGIDQVVTRIPRFAFKKKPGIRGLPGPGIAEPPVDHRRCGMLEVIADLPAWVADGA